MRTSPDGNIHKVLIVEGIWGKKPSERTECEIVISNCPQSLLEYNNGPVVIGDSDNYLRRNVDLCLSTMNEGETAKFKIMSKDIVFQIQLVRIEFKGYIHEWNAKEKFELAQNHKEKGVALYKQDKFQDAAHRFAKGLKIIHSIPIDAQTPPDQIDNIPLSDINKLKANLYNNLASYYLKKEAWLLAINACKRVFHFDKDNVKAHFKLAKAYLNDKNFENAKSELEVVLAAEPKNTVAIEHMKIAKDELRKAELKYNSMVKKMFV